MQVLNICTNSIALFAAFYFLIALAAHLSYRWQNPTIKPAAESPVLLLSPAADVEPIHPFEMSLQKMPTIEPIAAVHQPVATSEPQIDEAIALPPKTEPVLNYEVACLPLNPIAPAADDAPDLASLTIRQLKALASDRKLRGYSSLTKPQLIAALS